MSTTRHAKRVASIAKVVNARTRDGFHSAVVIEQYREVIKTANDVINLGPDGGQNAGELIACGNPDEIELRTP